MIRTGRKLRFWALIALHAFLIGFAVVLASLALVDALFPSVPRVFVVAGTVIALLCGRRYVQTLALRLTLAVDTILEARR
jgi:hypothetical protein